MRRPGKLASLVAFTALCLIWGSTWSVIQIGLTGIPPLSGVALRFAIASAILLVAGLVAGVSLGRTRAERWLWIWNALMGYTVSYGVVYWCEQWVPSGLAAVLFSTYPFFIAIYARFVLPEERITRLEVAGIAVGFAGVGVVFSQDFAALGHPGVIRAALVFLISPLVSAASTVAIKRWGTGVHPISLTSVPMAITAGIMGALALAFERDRPYVWSAAAIGSVFYLAVMGTAVTFSLYYWLLAHYPAKRMALITFIIPILAVGIGISRGEPLTGRILAGSALVLAGVALAIHGRPAPAEVIE